MKTSFISLFALTGLFASSCIASPVSTVAVEERADNASALAIVNNLYTQILLNTGNINSTLATITTDSTDQNRTTASTAIKSQISSITNAVNNAIQAALALQATPTLPSLPSLPTGIAVRQTSTYATAITLVLGQILQELSATLNGVIRKLGLLSIIGSIKPLVSALSNLISALGVVVDDLLNVVQQLLGGIVGSLGAGLSDITL